MARVMVEDSDLEFATLMFDAVIYWQDYFFGRMLEESWANAAQQTWRRVKNSNNATMFIALPKQFKIDDLVRELNVSKNAAGCQVRRWLDAGFVKRLKQGEYEKLVASIEKT